tara:strand:- start:2181 stop:2894 length:714 start_codon:yes stop_codon:yes gene_type:complete
MSIDIKVYSKKVESLKKNFSILNVDANKILNKYEKISFEDTSLSKKESFISLMRLNPSIELKRYLDSKTNLSHFKDKRSNIEYAIDLVLGWLSEDIIISYLREKNIKCDLNGRDKYREFLSPKYISAQPDIQIKTNERYRTLEIMNDWNDYWIRSDKLDLRDNKFLKLSNEKSLLLGIAPMSSKGIFLDFSEKLDFVERYNPAYGKKSYTLNGIKNKLLNLVTCISNLKNYIYESKK